MPLRRARLLLLPLLLTSCSRRPAPIHDRVRGYMRPPVALVGGIGTRPLPAVTQSGEAQLYFNQGLAYIYAFNFDEAQRSFTRAAELDPAAPMPEWGIALAVGPNYNDLGIGPERRLQAFQALVKAQALAKVPAATLPADAARQRERAWIDALAQRYSPAGDHAVAAQRYADAMGALAARYPDDLDAATLHAEALMELNAWNLWSKTGEPRPGTETIVRTLESVLRRDPNHVGANHLLIHAVEASTDPGVGLPSAGRLPGLAPAAGHLVHMPSHIDQRIGDFAGSAHANQQAIVVDDAFYRSQGNPPVGTLAYDSYRVHNMYFLTGACNMEGNDACAQQAAANLARYVAPAVPSGRMNPWFLVSEPWMLVRFRHWQTLLAAPLPKTSPPVLAEMLLYARTLASSATDQLQQADAGVQQLIRAERTLPASTPTDFGTPAKPIYTLARLSAQARLLEARGRLPQAIEAWREAVALQDKFGYSEPPDWYFPTREALGGALLRAHQPIAAEAIFREDLKHNPGNGRSLFGLWQALAAQHRKREAVEAQKAFTAAWAHADTSLSVADL